jgi:hypothetical protein
MKTMPMNIIYRSSLFGIAVVACAAACDNALSFPGSDGGTGIDASAADTGGASGSTSGGNAGSSSGEADSGLDGGPASANASGSTGTSGGGSVTGSAGTSGAGSTGASGSESAGADAGSDGSPGPMGPSSSDAGSDGGPRPDGDSFADGSATADGGMLEAGANPLTLAITSGDNQSAYIEQALQPVQVTLVDTASGQPVPDATLTVSAPTGVAISPSTVMTDANGTATILLRLSLTQGLTAIQVSAANANSITIHATAQAPSAGTVFTLANAIQAGETTPTFPAPATTTPVFAVRSLSSDSAGVIYYGDGLNFIASIDSNGEARLVTAQTAAANTGNGGPPSAAGVSSAVGPMPFLRSNQMLVNVASGSAVRLLDFGTNLASTYIGGGASTGVGILANTAQFENIYLLGADASSNTYFIADGGGYGAAYVVNDVGILNAWPVTDCTSQGFAISPLPADIPYSVFDADGTQYVYADICGTSLTQTTNGILSVASGGAVSHLAGSPTGSTSDGIAGEQALLSIPQTGGGGLAIGNGSLYFFDSDVAGTQPRIRALDLTTGIVTTIAGGIAIAAGADYVAASGSPVGLIYGLTVVGNDLVFAEQLSSGASRIRMIWQP